MTQRMPNDRCFVFRIPHPHGMILAGRDNAHPIGRELNTNTSSGCSKMGGTSLEEKSLNGSLVSQFQALTNLSSRESEQLMR